VTILLNKPIKPNLNRLVKYIEKVNNSGWYTNFGPLHEELTERLQEYLGVKNLLLVNNGTSALQVAGKALNTKSIIATPFSFVATISAYLWQGNQVSFTDIDLNSYNISPAHVEKSLQLGCNSDTILATHVYGNPCNVNQLENLQNKYNRKLIYDAAHAFGVKVKDNSVLSYGDASILSFHATKVFHTIEGGAIIFKKKDIYEKAKNLINFGINSKAGIENIGINAKLNEYNAAVGLTNLENISNIIDHRAEVFNLYRHLLKDYVDMPLWHNEASINGAYMPIKLSSKQELKNVHSTLSKNGIQSRHYFSPSLDLAFPHCLNYGTKNSRAISEHIICLPLHSYLTVEDVKKVVSKLKSVIL